MSMSSKRATEYLSNHHGEAVDGKRLDIVSQIQRIQDSEGPLDDKTRRDAILAARKLLSCLEKPEDVVMRQAFETHTYNLCIRLGIDLGVFQLLKERDGKPISAPELAEITGAETQFLVRIMRVITALDYAKESDVQTYIATPLTKAITIPALQAGFVHSHEHAAKINLAMPEYFRLNGYISPTDSKKGPFQYAFNTDLNFFDFVHASPVRMKNFNTFMSVKRSVRKHWVEWFPVSEELLNDFSEHKASQPDGVFLVDMGGGQGHDLELLLEAFPKTSGKLVLQDLPGTIANVKDWKGAIKPMVHDIFAEQTVIGAKAYYTHFLLHDFPDDECRVMLRHVKKAMIPGYSRLLLNETILPDMGCPAFFACTDITMMAVLAGLERSRKQWVDLLDSVGLKVVKTWNSPLHGDYEGVVEAMVEVW